MAQLEQWVPAEELASGIGALLAENSLSAEAKVEHIKDYAAQMGIPISVGDGKNLACIPSSTVVIWTQLILVCIAQQMIVPSSTL